MKHQLVCGRLLDGTYTDVGKGRKGYQHCGYMAAHTKEYVEELEEFIR